MRMESREWAGWKVLWWLAGAGWMDGIRAVEPGGVCRRENRDALPDQRQTTARGSRRSSEAMSQNVRSPFAL